MRTGKIIITVNGFDVYETPGGIYTARLHGGEWSEPADNPGDAIANAAREAKAATHTDGRFGCFKFKGRNDSLAICMMQAGLSEGRDVVTTVRNPGKVYEHTIISPLTENAYRVMMDVVARNNFGEVRYYPA